MSPTAPLLTPLATSFADALARYHRHRVTGLESLRASLREGPVVLVGNHCMDALDPLLFANAVRHDTGRAPRFIGHEVIFFRWPVITQISRALGVVPSRDMKQAAEALEETGMLMLFPGAGQEAGLRSYRCKPYTLEWLDRWGFVELALRAGARLHFVAGIGIDEMYYQTDIALPDTPFEWLPSQLGYLREYRGMRLQLGLAGIHWLPGVFPLPVRLTHCISPPLALDPTTDPDDHAALEEAQISLWAESQNFLAARIAERDRWSDPLDQAIRSAENTAQRLGI